MFSKGRARLPVVVIVALLAATAMGQTPPTTLSPAILQFGNVALGNSVIKTASLTNNQTVALSIASFSLTGNPDFALISENCTGSLPPGRTCFYHLAFNPSAIGPESASLAVNDSASNSPQEITLTGTGSPPATVAPTSITFPSQLITTTSASKIVTLVNNQTVALNISSPAISGNFALAGGTCGNNLPAFGKCTYLVTFTPPSVGKFTGSLTINVALSSGPLTVNLSGAGGTTGIQSITVAPASASIPSGTAQQFTASANLNNGNAIAVTNIVRWSSSNTKVVKVNAAGLASAIFSGTVTVTAILTSSLTSNATLTSVPVLRSIAVTPQNSSLPLGESQQFAATGSYNDGSNHDLTSVVTWGSSAPTIASIGSGGLAVASAKGFTSISASFSNITGSTLLTVSAPVLVSLTVSPANYSVATGAAQQFAAFGTFSDGSAKQLTTANWQSSNTSATIASTGVATGVTAGNTMISATLSSVTGSTGLTVSPVTLQSIAATPKNSTIAAGNMQQFFATEVNTDGSTFDLTNVATWTSSDSAVASIVSGGLATATTTGWTTITASSQGVSGSTVLSVTAPGVTLQSITMNSSASSINVGDTPQFTATGNFSDGSMRDLTSAATWYVNQVVGRYPTSPIFSQYAVPSSLVTGVLVELPWNAVDMGPGAAGGQYQWANFDATYVTPYTSMGKQVNLVLWGQNYPNQASTVPSYVSAFATNTIPGCSSFPTWVAPPYSPDFLTAYENFLAAVIQHYSGNPSIGYVRVGMSAGGEVYQYCSAVLDTYPAPPAYTGPPFNCDTVANVGQCVWLAYDQQVLNFVQSQTPTFTILGPSTSQNQGGLDPTNVFPLTEDDQAVLDNFGFGNQGLQRSDITNYANGLECNANWCGKFNQYTGLVPLEMQTAVLSDPTCTGLESICANLTGSLIDLLPFADTRLVTIFEIYEGDLYVALNPANPNYANYGTQYSSALQSALQSNPIASINSSGMATGIAPGSTTIYAEYGAIIGSAPLSVNVLASPSAKKPHPPDKVGRIR